MDRKDMLIILACGAVAAVSSVADIVVTYKEYKTTMNDHERIQQLEDTVKWMVKSDLDLQKEPDQSKN